MTSSTCPPRDGAPACARRRSTLLTRVVTVEALKPYGCMQAVARLKAHAAALVGHPTSAALLERISPSNTSDRGRVAHLTIISVTRHFWCSLFVRPRLSSTRYSKICQKPTLGTTHSLTLVFTTSQVPRSSIHSNRHFSLVHTNKVPFYSTHYHQIYWCSVPQLLVN